MNVLGLRNSAVFGSEPDVADWAARCALNASRVPPEHPGSSQLSDAQARLRAHAGPGLERLAELMV